jgi:hypothetical protein
MQYNLNILKSSQENSFTTLIYWTALYLGLQFSETLERENKLFFF